MNKIFKYRIIAMFIICCCSSQVRTASADSLDLPEPEKGSIEELYQDITLTMLRPYIDNAIDNYYRNYLKNSPGFDQTSQNVLSIDRPNGNRTAYFIIKIQVTPYFGPHVSVGVDNVTFKISAGDEVQIVECEHIKSFELPWNYQDEIINKWPPA